MCNNYLFEDNLINQIDVFVSFELQISILALKKYVLNLHENLYFIKAKLIFSWMIFPKTIFPSDRLLETNWRATWHKYNLNLKVEVKTQTDVSACEFTLSFHVMVLGKKHRRFLFCMQFYDNVVESGVKREKVKE